MNLSATAVALFKHFRELMRPNDPGMNNNQFDDYRDGVFTTYHRLPPLFIYDYQIIGWNCNNSWFIFDNGKTREEASWFVFLHTVCETVRNWTTQRLPPARSLIQFDPAFQLLYSYELTEVTNDEMWTNPLQGSSPQARPRGPATLRFIPLSPGSYTYNHPSFEGG